VAGEQEDGKKQIPGGSYREVWRLTRGAHGHEKVGEEILRVLCPNCSNRVTIEAGEDEVKCPHCGNKVKRPRKK
jgi:DNA-directed RNA polymerase subunit RPC12/RpoP